MALMDAEREALPLWLPVALGAGVAAWFLLPWEWQRLTLALCCGGLGLGFLLVRWPWAWALALMVALGLGAAEVRSRSVAHVVLPERQLADFEAVVLAVEPRAAREQLRLVLAVGKGGEGLPARVRVSLRGAAATRAQRLVAPGAKVAVRAMLMPPLGPAVPGGQDASRGMWFEGIGASGAVLGELRLLSPAPPPGGLGERLVAARGRLSARIRDAVPGAPGAVAAVFVTGERGAVPLDTAQAVRDSGLAHLLSISGLHMAVVVGGVIWLVRRLIGLWPWLALRLPVRTVALALGALAGLGYTLLAGGAVPTVRSLIAILIVLIGLMAGREAISLRLLAAAAFVILLLRPDVMMGPSFQMSFAAVAAIVALYESPAAKRMFGPDAQAGPLARLWRGFVALVVTGLVAEMVLAPIGLFHFQQTGIYGALANLLAIPLASFGIIPALVLGLAGDALGLGAMAYAPAGWMVEQLLRIAQFAAGLPGAVARLPVLPGLAFGLMIFGGLWVLLWRTPVRFLGVPLAVAGAVFSLAAAPADMLVSRDGRHVAVRMADGGLAISRPRMGAFLRDVWGASAAAKGDFRRFEDLPDMDCSRDACLGVVGGRTLFVTRSRDGLMQETMAPACAAADIVVSDRRLPDWCQARWLRLDEQALATRGAVAIWTGKGRAVGARDAAGDHPWR
jgi:competence protein ComEC